MPRQRVANNQHFITDRAGIGGRSRGRSPEIKQAMRGGDGEEGGKGKEVEGKSEPSVRQRVEHVEGRMGRQVGMRVRTVGRAEGN